MALCRTAEAEGVTKIVATPHVLRGPWLNDSPAERVTLVEELNRRLGGHPVVVPGCEYWFSPEVLDLVERAEGPLGGLNGSQYLLVEFAPGFIAPGTEDVFHELVVMGVVPVVAHPERNLVFAREPERLERLVELGGLVQLTAGSLLGDFGRGARASAEDLLRRGLVHVVASDAHSLEKRPPRLGPARDAVRRMLGAEVESLLFDQAPAAIVAGDDLT